MKKKYLAVLAVSAVMALAACGGGNQPASTSSAADTSASAEATTSAAATSESQPAKYEREDDDVVFDRVMGKFAEEYAPCAGIADNDERFVAYARAEATLLESGTMAITTAQGGNYAITRIAPRTAPYVFFGNDSDKIKSLVMTAGGPESFIKASDRAALLELWKAAAGGGDAYDPGAYLVEHGYTLGTEYKTTFSTPPATLDVLNTSSQADTEQLVNCVEGLIQYDNLGVLRPALASSWEISEDFKTYSFTIREGAKWFNNNRVAVADVTADDFVAGFQHMLDCAAGLEFLVDGVVEGVTEYLEGTKGFDQVGVKVENGKLVFHLAKAESYFITRLAYSCFMPMNREFYVSKGGKFGSEYDGAAETYLYGKDISSILFNSAFIPTTWDPTESGGSMVITKNENYWDAANVKVTKASWVYDDGSNVDAIYAATKAGDYPAISLTEGNGTLAKAKNDNLFDDYHYVSDTNAVTYFGGLNLNRGTFANTNGSCASPQNEEAKILTHTAMQNQNFRRAILHGWDRGTWNAVVYGEDLKYNNLRNMYTHPEYCTLSKDVTYDGVKFEQGLTYGQMVQKFITDVDGETHIDTRDGVDGWYDPEYATELMGKAREELKDAWPEDKKVNIDIVALGTSKNNMAQAAAFLQVLQKQFPKDIQVNIQVATNTADYYSGGYRTTTGAQENADIFYGSGWGPDYGDPSTYLDTFALGGYMLKVIGLY